MLGAVVLAAAGCTRDVPLGEVEGTVRLDGQPLDKVLVTFLPDPSRGSNGPQSLGVSDSLGRFRLRCEGRREGAIVGWHRVIVEDLAVYAAPRQERAVTAAPSNRSRIPPVYGDASRTPLLREIKAGKQAIELGLTTRASP